MADWESIADEKKKYAAYLCSREWGVKREAVRKRCNGKCERCKILPMQATHHLTYANKYDEPLEDLQAICQACHDFTHGKSDIDPVFHKEWLRYVLFSSGPIIKPFDPQIAAFSLACLYCLDNFHKSGRDEWITVSDAISSEAAPEGFYDWWSSGIPNVSEEIFNWSLQFLPDNKRSFVPVTSKCTPDEEEPECIKRSRRRLLQEREMRR